MLSYVVRRRRPEALSPPCTCLRPIHTLSNYALHFELNYALHYVLLYTVQYAIHFALLTERTTATGQYMAIFLQFTRLVVITIYFFTLLFQLLFRYKCNSGVSH